MEVNLGIQLSEGMFLNTVLHASDQVIIHETEEQLHRVVFKLQLVSKDHNLKISLHRD